MPQRIRHIAAGAVGALAALVAARLLLRLLAARPDNPVFGPFLALTAPPAWLATLDAGQPRFGATLEISTLALLAALIAAALLIAGLGRRGERHLEENS